jgi:hypothetical protein
LRQRGSLARRPGLFRLKVTGVAFYVICDPDSLVKVHMSFWVNSQFSKHHWLAKGKFLLRVVASEECATEKQVQALGLATLSEHGPLLPQHFDQFPELETLVPRGASMHDLNEAFDAVTRDAN